MWYGLIGEKRLDAYFYDGTLSGKQYIDFLKYQLPLLFDNVSLQPCKNFQ